MKKLLAILVIVMLAVPMFAGTDILNFMWFNNKIGMSFSDDWNIQSSGNKDVGSANNANANQWNYYGFLEQFMCGMWGTAYDGDPIKLKMDFFNYFSCEFGDWGRNDVLTLNEQIRFKGIMEVGSIYTLAVGGKGSIRLFPLGGNHNPGAATAYTAEQILNAGLISMGFITESLLLENTIKIPNILNISLNGEFQWVEWGGDAYYNQNWTQNFSEGAYTDFNIYIDAAVGNSYSFGFSWNLAETIIIGLDLQRVAGNDPAKSDQTVIRASYSQGAQPNYFTDVPLFKTQLDLSQNILSLVGVKDVSLVASASEQLQMMLPYSGGTGEKTKLFQTEGVYGLTVGFYGFTVGAFMTLATEDSYNTSVAMNCYAGKNVPKIPQAWSQRNPGRGQLGIMLKWGYSRGFFGFEMMYHGQGQVRDFDYNKNNFADYVGSDSGIFVDHGGLFRTADKYDRWTNNMFISINFSW